MMTQQAVDDISLIEVSKIFRLGIFRSKTAVQDLTLSIPKGAVVGLLGPNGSGKSTTLKMVLGFLKPSRGAILVRGMPNEQRHARALLGYLPENPRFPKFLTASEVLHYHGRLLRLGTKERTTRAQHMLERVGLNSAASERVQGFSKGMTQRLALAQSLLGHPSILVLDEPMSGLDPVGRHELRRLIREIHQDKPTTTLFLSTHVLSDVEELCTEVAVMKKGRRVVFCSVDELLQKNTDKFEIMVRKNSPTLGKTSHDLINVKGLESLIQELNELKAQGAIISRVGSSRKELENSLYDESEPGLTYVKPSDEARV